MTEDPCKWDARFLASAKHAAPLPDPGKGARRASSFAMANTPFVEAGVLLDIVNREVP